MRDVLFISFRSINIHFTSTSLNTMLVQTLLAGLCLATALEATPTQQDDPHGEILRFKRDAVPSARDLELADMHSVNVTESKSMKDSWENLTTFAIVLTCAVTI